MNERLNLITVEVLYATFTFDYRVACWFTEFKEEISFLGVHCHPFPD